MNLYQQLGIHNNAKPAAIEAAYQASLEALRNRHAQGEDVSQDRHLVQAAFEILSDPKKRDDYDEKLAAAQFNRKPAPKKLATRPVEAETPAVTQSPKTKFSLATAIYAISGFVLVYVFVSAFNTNELTRPKYDRFNAQVECEKFVTQRLKAPSTADFASMRDLKISGDGNGPWSVEGYVDAQNSFGAKIRSRYTCSVMFDNDRVSLLGLTIE